MTMLAYPNYVTQGVPIDYPNYVFFFEWRFRRISVRTQIRLINDGAGIALLCQTEAPPGKTEAQKMAANCDLSCSQEPAHLFGLIKLQNKTFGLELRELYTFTL